MVGRTGPPTMCGDGGRWPPSREHSAIQDVAFQGAEDSRSNLQHSSGQVRQIL